MANKNYEMPLPFRLLQQVPKRAWSLCDTLMEMKTEMQWNDMCVLPVAAGITVGDALDLDGVRVGSKICALYAWRKYKEVYSFDEDFANILMEQADEKMDIPIDILCQLPYPCIYIQFGKEGIFCFFEHDVEKKEFEFRMWRIDDTPNTKWTDDFPMVLHIEERGTVADCVKQTMDIAARNAEKFSIRVPDEAKECINGSYEFADELARYTARYLQLVLYICAENSEREENPEQKNITKRSSDYTSKPKDVFREVRKWDVGFRIGSMIRKANKSSSNADANSDDSVQRIGRRGGAKAPHARRGHWHHFWIGKMDGERKLILKWVAPMFINGNEDDVITTIHEVKGDENDV